MAPIFKRLQIRWKIYQIGREYAKLANTSRTGTKEDFKEAARSIQDRYEELQNEQQEYDSDKLISTAQHFDVALPSRDDADKWDYSHYRSVLSPNGRAHPRKLIDEEKTRRCEVKASAVENDHSSLIHGPHGPYWRHHRPRGAT
jgi:hypothetical protein